MKITERELTEYIKSSRFTVIGCLDKNSSKLDKYLNNISTPLISLDNIHTPKSLIRDIILDNVIKEECMTPEYVKLDLNKIDFQVGSSIELSYERKRLYDELLHLIREYNIRFIIKVSIYTPISNIDTVYGGGRHLVYISDLVATYKNGDNITITKNRY